MFNQITIIGIGLLGASLGMAVKKHKISKNIKVWARKETTLEKCSQKEWCDECESNLNRAVTGSEFVVVCTPVESIPSILEKISPFLPNGCIVTDVGSVKGKICDSAVKIFENSSAYFVGSHPMAGSEKSGLEYADENLFKEKYCVVAPIGNEVDEVLKKTIEFWDRLLMKTVSFTPAEHDLAVSYCSHLPHLVASCLAKSLKDKEIKWLQIAGNGLRDTTRIAEGSPDLWKQIILMNKDNIIGSIEEFEKVIDEIKKSLVQGNSDQLISILEQGANFRKNL